MRLNLTDRYRYTFTAYWAERDMAHDRQLCRILREMVEEESHIGTVALYWVVFDDGYITVASPSELVKVSR